MLPDCRRHDCQILRFIFLATMATMISGSKSNKLAARENSWYQRGRTSHEERITTDRHDFTQSAKTVGRGVLQVESGYTYFYKDEHETIEQSHTAPELMLRMGLTESIEFRLRWNYAWRFIDEEEDVHGSEDLRWSFKLAMTEEGGWCPETALEVRFTAPTGGSAWSTDRIEFGLDYIYAWEFAPGWELAGSTGYAENALADFGFLPEEPASEHFIAGHQSAVLGTELTERMTLYAEWFGIWSRGLPDEFVISTFNMGADYFVTDNFVLDVRIGIGLNEDTDDFFTGIGGGYRY